MARQVAGPMPLRVALCTSEFPMATQRAKLGGGVELCVATLGRLQARGAGRGMGWRGTAWGGGCGVGGVGGRHGARGGAGGVGAGAGASCCGDASPHPMPHAPAHAP